MTRKQLSSILDSALPYLALVLGLTLGLLAFGGCIPMDDGPQPDDMIELDGGEAARGCIQANLDDEGRFCTTHDPSGDEWTCRAYQYEESLGCCLPGATEDGRPAVRWFDCEEFLP